MTDLIDKTRERRERLVVILLDPTDLTDKNSPG